MEIHMKTCRKCLQTLELTEFYKNKSNTDGYQGLCKSCDSEKGKLYRLVTARESVLEKDRLRDSLEHRKQRMRTRLDLRKFTHPERVKAKDAVNRAIRNGVLQKWPVCAIPECCSKPEAHHPDYSRPLDVVWLCRSHHMQTHATVRTNV
jgi:hypothetical protein